jgi:molybdate/tungstate transport system substrate-binding protein
MGRIIRQLLTCTPALLIVLAASAGAQAQGTRQLNLCHAGSVSAVFTAAANQFKSQYSGVTVTDLSGGSLALLRQGVNGIKPCDVYASADSTNIDLFLKPAGLADYNIIFAQGRMVLAYLASDPRTAGIAAPGKFDPPGAIPEAAPNWYETLLAAGVKIGGGHPFLDPGAYRSHLIFQLAQAYYKAPDLYDRLLEHYLVMASAGAAPTAATPAPALGNQFNFQLGYEHGAQAAARKNPDYRYVYLPDNIDLSNSAKNSYYSQAVVVVPGLGLPGTAQSVTIPATRVTWGVTILNQTPNRENAIRFLQILLGSTGREALAANGPTPVVPPSVSAKDYRKLPAALQPLVKSTE